MAAEKPVEKSGQLRVPPEALMTVYLDEISSRLATLIEMEQKRTPEGIPVDFEETVTGTTLLDLINDRPHKPLFQIDVHSDGPDDVYVKVNDTEEVKIKPDRPVIFDYHKASIKKIQLRVGNGKTADVDIVGLY